jgi:hypothetical protein
MKTIFWIILFLMAMFVIAWLIVEYGKKQLKEENEYNALLATMRRFMITLMLIFMFQLLPAPGFNQLVIIENNELYSLNDQSIRFWFREFDVKEPDVVIRQMKHETGHFKSRFCNECNNLFGMRKSRNRETTAIGEDNHMAVYKTWIDSIRDYSLWQSKYYKGGDYFAFLKRHGYAEDKKYISKLKAI